MRLSAQCTDERGKKVTPGLFQRWPHLGRVGRKRRRSGGGGLIHSLRLYHHKARDRLACQMLISTYDRKVPDTMEELLKIPGVGRKLPICFWATSTTLSLPLSTTPTASTSPTSWGWPPERTRPRLSKDILKIRHRRSPISVINCFAWPRCLHCLSPAMLAFARWRPSANRTQDNRTTDPVSV